MDENEEKKDVPMRRRLLFLPFATEISKASSGTERVFWVALLLVCISCFGYCFCILLHRYLTRPMTSVFDLDLHHHQQLPDISVCVSDSPLNISHLLLRNFSQQEVSELYRFLTFSHYAAVSYKELNRTKDDILQSEHLDVHMTKNLSWDQIIGTFGPKCDQLFSSCRMNGMFLNCCAIAVYQIHPQKTLACFKFRNLTQSAPDMEHGLVITLQQKRAPPAPEGISHLPLTRGLVVLISNGQYHQQQVFPDEFIPIHRNKETFIKIHAKVFRRLSRGGNPCSEEENTGNYCNAEMDKTVEEFCNCSLPGTGTTHLPACLSTQFFRCLKNRRRSRHQESAASCLIPCKYRTFSSAVRDMELIPERFDVIFDRQRGSTDYYLVRMFYKDFTFPVISESFLVTFASVMSGIGGLMSLYLGMNIVNISRFLAFTLRGCFHTGKRVKNRKKRTRKKSKREVVEDISRRFMDNLRENAHFVSDDEVQYPSPDEKSPNNAMV